MSLFILKEIQCYIKLISYMSQISCCTLSSCTKLALEMDGKIPEPFSLTNACECHAVEFTGHLIHATPSPPSINLLLPLLPFLMFERLLQRNPKIVLLYALHVL